MVQRLIRLVYGEVKGLHKAASILALFALASQFLGLIRDRLLAHTFGASGTLDLYYAAFKIPDLLYVLFASVLSVYVLLPFVTKAKAETGEKEAKSVLDQMFTLFLVCYVVVAAALFVLMPWCLKLIYPGFTPEAMTELVSLTRLLLLQPFLLGLSSLVAVVTQLAQKFVLYALSPLLYNLGIIAGVLWLYPKWGLSGLIAGVVLGAALHLLIQMPVWWGSTLRFSFDFRFNFKLLKQIFLVAVPRAVTLSLHQVLLLIFFGLASLMAAGSISAFQFAFNLQSVPLAIIGMSYSVAAFPVLADLLARQKLSEVVLLLTTAVRHIIFWSLPVIALIIVVRAQIVRVLLGSGEFSWNDTRLTAALLAVFAVGILAQSLLLLLVRAFYAAGNTATPLKVALFSAGGSLLSAGALLTWFEYSAGFQGMIASLFRLEAVTGTEVIILAMAFTIGVIIEISSLLYLSARRFGVNWLTLSRPAAQALLAALAAGSTAYVLLQFMAGSVNQETFIGVLIQGAVAFVGGLAVATLTYYLTNSSELREVVQAVKTKLQRNTLVTPPSEPL